MVASTLTPPTHLAIFVTDPVAGTPVQRLPVYAEVTAPRIVPPRPPASSRLRELLLAALIKVDPDIPASTRDAIGLQVLKLLGEMLSDNSLAALFDDFARTSVAFQTIFKFALDRATVSHFAAMSEEERRDNLTEGIRFVVDEQGWTLFAAPAATPPIWSEPLGVLTTDHVGYISFDLTRLSPAVRLLLVEAIAARRDDPDAALKLAIYAYPYGQDRRHEVLTQARFAADAVVARFEAVWHTLPDALINMGPSALQNPSLTDWRLSPASFASSPKILVGEDGCEQLVPANLALAQFVLRQVVRLNDAPGEFGLPPGEAFRAAYIDEYKVSWFALGHSLGEILYSLPLAPGETVKLAVLDWTWDSLTNRTEDTKLTEQLLHQTHRDRTISETVQASLKELQHGSSFMGGMANSVGASGGANLGIVGIGAAAGNTWSLGGSTSTSEGSRALAAQTVQRVNDSFVQASSSQREINSTVVIQASQSENEIVQTRTFSNYNHSHTLTVLYYEVLRHYRVTVEWVRRKRAVLAKVPARLGAFNDDQLLKYRVLLDAALLDPSVKVGFDALDKLRSTQNRYDVQGINPAAPVPAPWWEGTVELELFEIGLWSRDKPGEENITIFIVTAGEHARSSRYELHYVYKGSGPGGPNYAAHNANSGGRLDTDSGEYTCFKIAGQAEGGESIRIRWAEVLGFQFEKWGDSSEWRIDSLSLRGFDRYGFTVDFTPGIVDVDLYIRKRQPGSQTFTLIKRPAAPEPAPAAPPTAEGSLSAEESYALKRLRTHVDDHADYYGAVVLLGTSTVEVALAFEKQAWAGGTMDDYVEPTPLEVFGSYIAYPLMQQAGGIDDSLVVDLAAGLNSSDPAARQKATDYLAALSDTDRDKVAALLPLASSKSERLVTLPTRGVFAEGKLGHCNVSEVIDETRFWRWDEHGIPIQAPDIAPTQMVTPQPQAVATSPTPFPQSLLNIVNPTAAPDPTGLAAALTLLSTPNIFRDMSGRQEVADLLKKLSDNSISIAEAATKAQEIQAKYGADLNKNATDLALGAYKADADVAAKQIDADATKAKAQADLAKAQADMAKAQADKAQVDSGVAQARAARELPQAMQKPVQQAAANKLAGNPVNDKVVVFKAIGFNNQTIDGWFAFAVRDITAGKDVITEAKVGAYFDRKISFESAEPRIEARASRKETVPIKLLDDIIFLPAIDAVSPKDSYKVGKSDSVINVTLIQAARDVQFKASSTNGAVDELMNKWGVELGVNKVVAAKIIADYETKHSIKHADASEKTYTINVPTENYEMKITSS